MSDVLSVAIEVVEYVPAWLPAATAAAQLITAAATAVAATFRLVRLLRRRSDSKDGS